ncbi:MAG TPA: O-methyltransferase [Steroidobacteraceae bacterium]|jgi:predicted O-methyltransferase YrrM|nr:O-methyltransferase [Steroidobacteraceae bacterium]
MDEPIWTKLDMYFNEHLVGADSALRAAVQSSHAAGLPSIQISPTQGKLLMLLARALGARRILEIGTLGGYSTIWLARALPPDGCLISCELKPAFAEVARSNLQRAGAGAVAQIRVGRASDTLAKLIAEHAEPFDFVFIDADKSGYPDYLTAALKLSRPGTLIVADNVVRDGRVADENTTDPDMRGLRRYIEMVGAEPRLSATALQTVGEKGYDGFALALVSGAG